ncbi:right-handed parallel beta-helix repeat-containing protein [Thalassomonas viridans]|uniref:Right-handed parallel beta-helix repeat-containing protein n=1 Tax=Thalassomonas viridans TaxID=137584 RepID=A0AAF0CBK5_9GAMM|nr:CARDB domain-containing protein [Thalassomonas viridans]WDE06719.1 right-handed parallel beta-helix repeat-containing protein [Thalassomonas viridans]
MMYSNKLRPLSTLLQGGGQQVSLTSLLPINYSAKLNKKLKMVSLLLAAAAVSQSAMAATLGQGTTVSPSGDVYDLTPTFEWNAIPGAVYYRLSIQKTSGGYAILPEPLPSSTSHTDSQSLTAGQCYNWWIRGERKIGDYGPWSAVKTFCVKEPLPDVVVRDINWSPVSPEPGETVTFSATLENYGTADTPSGVAVGTGLQVGGSYVGAFFVRNDNGQTTSLAAGEEYVGSFSGTWPASSGTWPASSGSYAVKAVADDINRFTESNDNNNSLTGNIEVVANDACHMVVEPADFGSGGNLNMDPAINTFLNSASCSRVSLRLKPGNYLFDEAIDFRGNLSGGKPDISFEFDQGDYHFSHELMFSYFNTAAQDVVIKGAGKEHTWLKFCLTGTTCSSDGWGMLHFRQNPEGIVISDLSIEGKKHSTTSWAFDGAIMLSLDGTLAKDVSIEDVRVKGAEYGIFAKHSQNLSIRHSRIEDSHIGVYLHNGDHHNVLIYDNVITNDSQTSGGRYGIFSTTAMLDSAIVKNNISNLSERGIYPGPGSQRLWIHNNSVDKAGLGGNGAGININKEDLVDILVSKNSISNIGGGVTQSGLGSLPISDSDEDKYTQNSTSVSSTTIWPNRQWNGYGISTSGAVSGGVALVDNDITGAASHGIKVNPGAENVLIYKNQVENSGVNGLSIVPGYAYGGQFGYTGQGGISDVWVQDNSFNSSGRAGIEILSRGTPLFAVPASCEDETNCTMSQTSYGVCSQVGGNPCVDLYSTTNCGDNCYLPTWQDFQVDLHANTTKDNDIANMIINPQRVVGSSVNLYYAISGMAASHMDSNHSDNYHLYPSGHIGQNSIPSGCLSHSSTGTVSRSDNTAVSKYNTLVNKIDGLSFLLYDESSKSWQPIGLDDESRFVFERIDFGISAPGC